MNSSMEAKAMENGRRTVVAEVYGGSYGGAS